MKIATLLTVFNRRQKTLDCLHHLFTAVDTYNGSKEPANKIEATVFMTDDGCTDGTAEAVSQAFGDRELYIVKGTGSLYWAGGMRKAWQTALDTATKWDYFLLLNDDTNVFENVFEQLFEADDYGFRATGRHGLSSGITCQPGRPDEITYGGLNFVNRTKGRQQLLQPSGVPQRIDLTHANILMVHSTVAETIGIFHKGFRHSCADNDYSMTAHRHQLPAYSTSSVCGECEYDHDTNKSEIERLITMTLAERRRYINSPTHSDNDYLLFVRRNMPLRYPVAFLLRKMRLYCPSLYQRITHLRGVYK